MSAKHDDAAGYPRDAYFDRARLAARRARELGPGDGDVHPVPNHERDAFARHVCSVPEPSQDVPVAPLVWEGDGG